MSKWIESAQKVRAAMDAAGAALEDEQAAGMAALFMPWASGRAYAVGQRVRHADLLYRCLQAHTSYSGWAPGNASSLWVRADDPAIEWPLWRQPLGAEDAYPSGAKVTHNGAKWISTAANNVWAPGVYGWDRKD